MSISFLPYHFWRLEFTVATPSKGADVVDDVREFEHGQVWLKTLLWEKLFCSYILVFDGGWFMQMLRVYRLVTWRFLYIVQPWISASPASVLLSHALCDTSISLTCLLPFFYQSRRSIHYHCYICYRTLPVKFLSSPTLTYIVLAEFWSQQIQTTIKKPVYSTKSTTRLISTLPKLPPWTSYPTVTRKCTAVAGNPVHSHCVMDLTWLTTKRLGTTLALWLLVLIRLSKRWKEILRKGQRE